MIFVNFRFAAWVLVLLLLTGCTTQQAGQNVPVPASPSMEVPSMQPQPRPPDPIKDTKPTVLPSAKREPVNDPFPVPKSGPTPAPKPVQMPTPSKYSCAIEKTCKQMFSCEEAYYHLTVCGFSKRDGDDDGVPCEDIC